MQKIGFGKKQRAKPPRPGPRRPLGMKDLARKAVRDAIRAGRLTRPSRCQLCGRHKDDPNVLVTKGRHSQAIQADHGDYARPLEVVWLCIRCHQGFTGLRYFLVMRARKAGRKDPWPWWCWLCLKRHRCRRMSPTGIRPAIQKPPCGSLFLQSSPFLPQIPAPRPRKGV